MSGEVFNSVLTDCFSEVVVFPTLGIILVLSPPHVKISGRLPDIHLKVDVVYNNIDAANVFHHLSFS